MSLFGDRQHTAIGSDIEPLMKPAAKTARRRGAFVTGTLPLSLMLLAGAAGPALAAGCAFEPQGEGRVVAIIDSRTFRLQDGREVILAGIELVAAVKADAGRAPALAALVAGREVTLSGEDDAPDRYGRQPAFAYLEGAESPVQGLLLEQGEALVSASVGNKDCASVLFAAEAAGRAAKRGIWADPSAIKNAESPGDILAGIGRFMVVEGKVLSVRQAGATTYLNFERSWTRGFAATISRRVIMALEANGFAAKSLENRRIRVRGWVEARGGARIEVLRAGQIELLGEN
jgi:endonuclease YncB( thermonuclease family)